MRILKLSAVNFKRLKEVEIRLDPKANMLIIGGRNEQGKSSLLDAAEFLFCGGKSKPKGAIRRGAKSSQVVGETEDLIISRNITAKTDKLEVKNREGAVFSSPQKMLDKLVGPLSFDPLAFVRLGETASGCRRQAEILRGLVGLDFAAIDGKRKGLYDRRTETNRKIKELEAIRGTFRSVPDDTPEEEVGLKDIMAELDVAQKANRAIAEVERQGSADEDARDEMEEVIALREKALAAMKSDLNGIIQRITNNRTARAEMRKVDETSIRQRAEDIEIINQHVRAKKSNAEAATKLSQVRAEAEGLSNEIAGIDAEKESVLAAAKMPIEGLSFDEEGVTYKETAFEECSQAEQLRVSVAVGLAENPELRVMAIRDGSLLDDTSLQLLDELAEEHDAYLWIERVGKNKQEMNVIIEDGLVEFAK